MGGGDRRCIALLYMVAFSKLSCGHFGVITLLLQWSVSIVIGGLLLPTGHTMSVNSHLKQ